MKEEVFRIESSLGNLDSYGGGDEWGWQGGTVNCWYMSLADAKLRLEAVKRTVPDAVIVSKKGKKQ